MCPLRLILIFLSATLAGFFVLRNLKSQPQQLLSDKNNNDAVSDPTTSQPCSLFSKVRTGMESGFWTCVDMASGRYLWRIISKRSD